MPLKHTICLFSLSFDLEVKVVVPVQFKSYVIWICCLCTQWNILTTQIDVYCKSNVISNTKERSFFLVEFKPYIYAGNDA